MALLGHRFCNFLEFRFGGWQFARRDAVRKANPVMAAVAERLVGRVSAATERNYGAAGKSEGCTGGVEDFEIALHTDGAVVVDCDFGRHDTEVAWCRLQAFGVGHYGCVKLPAVPYMPQGRTLGRRFH